MTAAEIAQASDRLDAFLNNNVQEEQDVVTERINAVLTERLQRIAQVKQEILILKAAIPLLQDDPLTPPAKPNGGVKTWL